MAHLLTLEGDAETFTDKDIFLNALAETLSGDVPDGYEPIEMHGDFEVTDETDDFLYGDAIVRHVVCQSTTPDLNGELGKFSLKMKSPFRFKGFKMPKISAFKGLKLGKIKMPFKANIKGLTKGISKNVKGFTQGIAKNVKGFTKGFSKFGSKIGEALSQGAEGLMDMASQMMPGAEGGAMPEEAPPEEEMMPDEMAMQEQALQEQALQEQALAYNAQDPYQQEQALPYGDPGVQMAQEFGPAWFDAADEMAGELGKKSSGKNRMLGVNLLALASGNPQIMKMAALANVSQAQRNQATRDRRRATTQGLLKTGLSLGAGVLTGGAALPALLPSLSGILGSGGLGALTSALGPLGSSLGGITKTLGINGLQDFAGLMGPGGISQIASKLGSGGLGSLLSQLGPEAAKLATSEGAKRLVSSLTRTSNSQDLLNMLRNQLAPVTPPPAEVATVTNDQVTFTRPRGEETPSSSSSNNTALLIGGAALVLVFAMKGKRS